MPAPDSVREAYGNVEGLLANVQDIVSSTLKGYCSSNNYLFFDRVKTLESLAEKLEGGRVDRWSALDDLYACTIIVPTASHENSVLRKLDACFDSTAVRSRETAQKAPDVFRFDATRYYARLREEQVLDKQPGLRDVQFEIQINTVFEYAWTRVTHDLVYKSDSVDWRRLRLAAQLKAAVEQIESTISAFEDTAAVVPQSSWVEIDTKTKIVEFFKQLVSDGIVMKQLEPSSWRRFGENVYQLVRSYCRNSHAVADKVDSLLSEMSTSLRGANPVVAPASGTLFQLVIAHVASEGSEGDITKFTVVPSAELESIYGVHAIPKSFVFDLPGRSASSPEDVGN